MQSIAFSKVAVIAVAVALVFGSVFAVSTAKAHAITATELLDLLIALDIVPADKVKEARAALGNSGGSTSSMSGSGCGFTRNLTLGASGADVTCLQDYLTGTGHFTFSGGSTGFFGPVTQSAVAAWQTTNSVSPAAGYFGMISRSKYQSMMSSRTGTGATRDDSTDDSDRRTVSLSGGAGSIDDADFIGGLNNEEVGEDEKDAEVAGLEIEADDNSDLMIVAVELNFDPVSGVGNNDLDDYAKDVSIWLDGEEFARVDAGKFEDDDDFNRTVTLDAGAVIKAGRTGKLVVALTGISNLDSADKGDKWNVSFPSVRFEDASGAVITDNGTGDIGETDDNDRTDENEREFSFETFASAADVDLRVRVSDDTPKSGVVNVDDNDDTDNVELLVFTLEAKGKSDVHVRDLPITFTVAGTAANVKDVINNAVVTIGGEEFSETVTEEGKTASTTFDDFDYTIKAGKKVTVTVKGDINDTQAGSFVDGDTLVASFTQSNREAMDAEDESGENLSSSDKSGTATGETLAFYDVGPMVSFVSASESVTAGQNAGDDSSTFTVKYRIEAFDGTIYVSNAAAATTSTSYASANLDSGVLYRITRGGTATTSTSNVVDFKDVKGDVVLGTGDDSGVVIEEGEAAEFTLTVQRTNTDVTHAGIYQVLLKGIAWNTDGDGSAAANVYTFNLEDYKTDPISLN